MCYQIYLTYMNMCYVFQSDDEPPGRGKAGLQHDMWATHLPDKIRVSTVIVTPTFTWSICKPVCSLLYTLMFHYYIVNVLSTI